MDRFFRQPIEMAVFSTSSIVYRFNYVLCLHLPILTAFPVGLLFNTGAVDRDRVRYYNRYYYVPIFLSFTSWCDNQSIKPNVRSPSHSPSLPLLEHLPESRRFSTLTWTSWSRQRLHYDCLPHLFIVELPYFHVFTHFIVLAMRGNKGYQ